VSTAEITAHALSAGLIIGLVYGSMPTLGLLLGLAIVSHKGPAGYAAARRLSRQGEVSDRPPPPAAGVGITAIPTALLPIPPAPAINAVVFGFAAGIFLHVAMDFLPQLRGRQRIDEVCSLHEHSHDLFRRVADPRRRLDGAGRYRRRRRVGGAVLNSLLRIPRRSGYSSTATSSESPP